LIDNSVITHGGLHPNYEEEIKYFKEGKVYSVQIESNLSCHQGCLYCYAGSKNPPIKEMAKKDIVSILDSSARMKVRAIDWLGGDPLLRSDWYELMNYALDKGLKNNIWTSGLPLENAETARKVVEVTEKGFISVHLDSLDPKIYKKLHGGDPKKKIKSILKGVDNVQSFGKKPDHMINCITFTKPVVNDVEKTIGFFFKEKGMRTCLTQMCLTGLAEEHKEWVPNLQDIKKACDARDRINYPDSKYSMGPMDTNKFYCGGMICVTVDGDVTPCSVIRKGFGNIHDLPLEKIVKEHQEELLFIHIRNKKNLPGHCSSCENNSVCWGCRATAYYESGDICGFDTKCYKNY
jgi:radical SAM protein with 4Fe4S-binding SPASM domain